VAAWESKQNNRQEVDPIPIFNAGSASVQVVPDFSGTQRAIGEFFARQSDVKVTVRPDLSSTDVARTEAELNAMRGTAKVEIDRNVLSSSIAGAIQAAMATSGLEKLSGLLTAAIAPTAITAIGGAFVELAAAASQAVGALALAPAVIAAVATPAAVVAIGVHGIADAFKAINTGDATKIAQAMAELAPSAQNLVTQVHALGPAWTALRLDVQQALFVGVGTAVTNLAGVALPILHTGLTQVAAAMNGGLLATMSALQGQGAAFTTTFANIAASIRVAAAAAAPLVQAFATLGAVGSQFLPALAQGFVNVAAAFNGWVQHMAASGQLVVIIQNALTVLHQLVDLAANAASVVAGVFTVAIPYGNILLDVLIRVTGSLATFVHSADGQAGLGAFFSGITVALGTLLPALDVLVQAIVTAVLPAIGQFAAILAPIAGQLLVQLASVLVQVGGILPSVASVMGALVNATAPLIPVIGAIVTTLLPPLVAVLGQLAPIISQVATIMGQALLQAVQTIAPVLPLIGNAFISILNALLPLLPPLLQIVQQLLPPLLLVVVALVPVIQQLVAVFAPLLGSFLQLVQATVLPLAVSLITSFAAGINVLSGFIGPLAPVLQAVAIAVGVWTAAQWLLNIALDANPLGLLVLAIAAVIVAIGEIVTHLQFFKDLFTTVVDWVVAHWQLVVLAIPGLGPVILGIIELIIHFQDIWTTVIGAISTAWQAFWGFIQTVATTVWNAVSSFFTVALNAFVSFWQGIWNGVSSFFQTIWNGISSFFTGLWNALWTWFQAQLSNFLAGWQVLWSAVSSFFTTIWNAISATGQAIWNALASFFTNAWNALSAAWTNFWSAVFAFFQNLWNTLVAWAQATWNALASFFTNAWNAFTAAWTNFWNAVFAFFQNLWNTLVAWAQATWNALQNFFNVAWNAFTTAWTGFWSNIFAFFQTLWNNLVSWVQGVWNGLASWFSGVWNAFTTNWSNFWNAVGQKFSDVWNGIKGFAQQVWNDIKAIIATPVNFVIGTILNGGLFKAWNAVNDFLHLPFHIGDLPLIPGFAKGGYTGDAGLFGTDSPHDPAGIVHAKEFVFTANQVDNAGGPNAMYSLASQLDSGYAMGGLVRRQASDPHLHQNAYVVPPDIAPRVQNFLNALSVGQAEAVQAAGGFDALGPGFFWGGYADGMSAAKAVAQSMNGQPYVWGGVGPVGADCSGYQSVITNALRGANNPFFRVGTTATFPWSGFTPGLTSSYAVGSVNDAGGGIGHMAGTLGGINVESGGVHNNVAFGGPAAGAQAGLFNIHASLPSAGGVYAPGFAGAGATAVAPTISVLGKVLSSATEVLSTLTDSVTGPVNALLSQFSGNKFVSIISEMPKKLLGGLWGLVKDKIESYFTTFAANVTGSGSTPSGGAAALKDQAFTIARSFGWTSPADDAALDYIASHESGWNPTAQNPVSTASGIWQLIDGTWRGNRPNTASGYAHAKDAPTDLQDIAAFNYIQGRFGNPPAAQAYWAAHGNYDTGGWLPPGATTVMNGTGGFEAVLNQAQQSAVVHAIDGRSSGGEFHGQLYLDSGEFVGMVRGIAAQVSSDRSAADARNLRSTR
jgi:phage-related protein